ncbi:glycogen debranching enzyme [Cokeromyces recurvatus]|uniref:glycogen debranching enzyme n=1 Tax=Cokeromyces recurvatus TaxID=90255 RepID=UPI00221E46DC|nr:glycogen debranching enzyme [Cokeromyces recurvatus]KAI7900607.1 glycogen debranching enzyme [Cokeromyces recurvatus]
MVHIEEESDAVQNIPRLYALTLADDVYPYSSFKGKVIIRFILKPGSLAAGGRPTLYTNYPITGEEFERHNFHPVKFIKDPHLLHAYCDITLDFPGAYEYKVEYTCNKQTQMANIGYVIAEPRIQLPHLTRQNDLLPLDALMILSMVPKWMGPITKWDKLIEQVKYAGYNMIHFVPLQKRGISNSPYSISDQLAFDDDVFEEHDRQKSNSERVAIVQQAIERLSSKYGILSLSDVVWNHTSNSTEFLLKHPEAGYNLHNSPHLVPAYELDTALVELSGKFEQVGLPRDVKSPADADIIIDYIKNNTFKEIKLYEYKVIDVASQLEKMREALKSHNIQCDPSLYQNVAQLPVKERVILFGKQVVQNGHLGSRFHKTVDMSQAVAFLLAFNHISSLEQVSEDRVDGLVNSFQNLLNDYNLPLYEEYDEDCKVALDNIKGRLLFTRLAENGPKLGTISKSNPVIETYFTRLEDKENQHPKGSMMLANNGWIWNADPLNDFAGPGSNAYLRREVIVWGDCVKLRYGQSPNDNPWLWKHMRDYTELIASMFHGIRIDNCHSTPIHVAEYLLDAARKVRPDLYVLAELFTGSAERDNEFVSRLGIHALIREAMQAWDTHELSRLTHRHGGKPVGSMDEDMIWKRVPYEGDEYDQVLLIPIAHGSMPRALFMDCTHDNETPFQKRTAEDALPNAAIVAFSDCAIGSVKGYDEIYPRLLDIVNEKRKYDPNPKLDIGILEAKHKLLNLHQKMCFEGYREVYVHQENDYLLVHRQHPSSQSGYLLISRTAFPGQGTGHSPIRLRKSQASFEFAYSLKIDNHLVKEAEYLNGLPTHLEPLNPPRFEHGHDEKGEYVEIILSDNFTPGSICVLKTSIGDKYKEVRKLISIIDDEVVKDLDLLAINVVLYRCSSEEYDSTGGDGVYNVPNYGNLVYAGLQGFMSVLNLIIENNDLGHPLCDNLRAGQWALDYSIHRLEKYKQDYPSLERLIDWFKERAELIRQVPDFLVPKCFALIIKTAYDKVYAQALTLMSPLVQNGDTFIKQLAMTSVQMLGQVPSAGLCPTKSTPSLAAGLPHFTIRHMRVWGRDVCISLRGLLMVTGRFKEAKEHILAFAGSLRHGLIPNLLDSVRYPRYNSRDSVWFFMQSIQDYYHLAPDGHSILNTPVPRRFPKEDRFVEVEEGYQYSTTIAEIIQEIFERHAHGIHFREYNAGSKIDEQMSDKGFNIDIDVDWSSGVLVGGNIWNCGTWMDKMGESVKAGNKGYPGTPRDGAPIEITGLLKSSLRWINQLIERGQYSWTGIDNVKINNETTQTVTYKFWNDLLQENFERVYYIPSDPSQDKQYDVISKIVNRRGVYKDVYRATEAYTEYELRPNIFIAMTVAPELFDKEHAKQCITLCRSILLGPLGMRTLDPTDQQYRPYYHNSEDSDDFKTAKGRNYHQGPEWLWPIGYYLRAAHYFDALSNQEIASILREHRKYIDQSVWCGLPELTNKDGEFCEDSCTTQSWSSATLLELFYDLIEGNKHC